MEYQERISKDTSTSSRYQKEEGFLSIKISNEKVHDGDQLKHLVDDDDDDDDDVIIKNNRIVAEIALADGSYDSNKNFRYLSFNDITPAIKVKEKCNM
jgi:hypothetical protein